MFIVVSSFILIGLLIVPIKEQENLDFFLNNLLLKTKDITSQLNSDSKLSAITISQINVLSSEERHT